MSQEVTFWILSTVAVVGALFAVRRVEGVSRAHRHRLLCAVQCAVCAVPRCALCAVCAACAGCRARSARLAALTQYVQM